MNANEYDRIVERYVDGQLSPAETTRFQQLLAIDPDARRLLDAELAVRAAFEGDRDAIPVATDGPYARFLGALAATPTTAPAPGVATRWLQETAYRGVAVGLLVIGLVIGGSVALRDGSMIAPGGRPDLRVPAEAHQVQPSTAAVEQRETDAVVVAPQISARQQPSQQRSKWPTHARTAGQAFPRDAGTDEIGSARASDDARAIEALKMRDADLPLILSDSVHGRVNLTRKPGD